MQKVTLKSLIFKDKQKQCLLAKVLQVAQWVWNLLEIQLTNQAILQFNVNLIHKLNFKALLENYLSVERILEELTLSSLKI